MSNDYRNSTAQLAVDFLTEIQVSTNPGDNYMRTALFIDRNADYVTTDGESAFIPITKNAEGATINDLAVVTKNNYTEIASGRLLTWLTDLFCNGQPFELLLLRFGPEGGLGTDLAFDDSVRDELRDLVNKIKAAAYHKTILCQDNTGSGLLTGVTVFFASLLKTDYLLNSKPYVPHIPEIVGEASTDPLWNAAKSEGVALQMCYHSDHERNGALFQLGIALNGLNGSGTPVGDSFDYVMTNLITPSGQPPADPGFEYSDWEDYNLSSTIQSAFDAAHISFFRTIGNGTGYVEAVGDVDTQNGVMQADWIVNFCNFVNKVKVAERISRKNTLKNSRTYTDIMNLVMATVRRFGDFGSGKLKEIVRTAPAFEKLPVSGGREIIIPNAWQADYVFGVHKVRVYGVLTISM